MGVVTVSSSASQTPLGLSTTFSTHRSTLKKPLILAFKADKSSKTSLVAPHEPIILPIESGKEIQNRVRKAKKTSKRVKAAATDEASTSTMEVDYNEAAAKLENIFKLSPASMETSDVDDAAGLMSRGRRRRRKVNEDDDRTGKKTSDNVIRSRKRRATRLSLDKRIALKRNKEDNKFASIRKRKESEDEKNKNVKEVVLVRKRKDSENENEKIDKLVREYSASTDLVSLDWKKMKIPPVLPSSEHTWLFKLMQPLKVSQFFLHNFRRGRSKDNTKILFFLGLFVL